MTRRRVFAHIAPARARHRQEHSGRVNGGAAAPPKLSMQQVCQDVQHAWHQKNVLSRPSVDLM
eukprot:5738644-Pyramimonas_sp.AAC.1